MPHSISVEDFMAELYNNDLLRLPPPGQSGLLWLLQVDQSPRHTDAGLDYQNSKTDYLQEDLFLNELRTDITRSWTWLYTDLWWPRAHVTEVVQWFCSKRTDIWYFISVSSVCIVLADQSSVCPAPAAIQVQPVKRGCGCPSGSNQDQEDLHHKHHHPYLVRDVEIELYLVNI